MLICNYILHKICSTHESFTIPMLLLIADIIYLFSFFNSNTVINKRLHVIFKLGNI